MSSVTPQIIRLRNSELDQDKELQQRFGEILQDAVWANPWKLRWDIGLPQDLPSSSGSICSYHNLLRMNDADFLRLICRDSDGVEQTVGYAIGVVLTEELIGQTHISEGLNHEKCRIALAGNDRPLPGDYYLAVTGIQGDNGVNDEPRETFRGLRIKGKSVYRLLIELRLRLGFNSGARKFWVRTATGQEIVRGVYRSIGFSEVGQSEVQQGETTVARTVMACHYSNLVNISMVSNSVEGVLDWVSVE